MKSIDLINNTIDDPDILMWIKITQKLNRVFISIPLREFLTKFNCYIFS